MFEPYRFDTDTCQDLLEELCELDLKVEAEYSVMPEDVHAMIDQPLPFIINEGPWPMSSRTENWAS